MSKSPKRIGIAVVEHQGFFLIGTRGPDGPLAGYAEFPGGKCLTDESPEDCAIRECLEESHLRIAVVRFLLRREYSYAHATVDLHFFLCRPADATSVRDEHNGFRWIAESELANLKLPEANAPVLELLGKAAVK